MRRLLLTLCLLVVSLASPLLAQKHCTKGIPCGNTCIAADRVCHVGPATPPPAAASPIPLGTFSHDGSLPWVASSRGRTYYVNSRVCPSGQKLKNKIYFRSEDEARAKGYARSGQREC